MTPRRWAAAVGLVAALVGAALALRPGPPDLAQPAADPVIEAGRALFLRGVLPSGEPVKALVMGDVPMAGDQVPCASCHGRSGMGTGESGGRTPPIAGPLLYADDARHSRPPYTDETVLRALREGVDSGGRKLAPLMPRFQLPEDAEAALLAYLRTLGSTPSPGAQDATLHIGTVFADDADEVTRAAVQRVLQAFVETKNAEMRNDRARSLSRRTPGQPEEPYRDWELHVWDVHGPSATWGPQLAAHYADQPVFALISGLGRDAWDPVHTFCDAQQVPCLLPSTDVPPADDVSFYSLYFSGGVRLEAQVAATELAASPGSWVQVVDGSDPASRIAADALDAALGAPVQRVEAAPPGSSAVAWVRPAGLGRLGDATRVVLSGTLLGGRWDDLPAALRARASLIDPFRLPGDADPALGRFRAWASARHIPLDAERQQAEAWFACVALLDGAKHVARYPQRDYLLDNLDHAAGLPAFLPIYPRPTVGPGQRRLAKGAWWIDLAAGAEPRWIVP